MCVVWQESGEQKSQVHAGRGNYSYYYIDVHVRDQAVSHLGKKRFLKPENGFRAIHLTKMCNINNIAKNHLHFPKNLKENCTLKSSCLILTSFLRYFSFFDMQITHMT